ncbi:glycerol-3-phosphate ABC transporter ATP-binding protein [Rhizobium sp. Leaf384]|uniref:ABC transporter ATP-binding protein n=1 Tax=unclassified Rhizobium TaxID=2613769 RepID=UPI00071369F4|nr:MULTISPECIES: ABC transporter ATP-binding protein [unclassified Rhizobium]KQS75623.1 glycerol-3-phosphate ABC transporter ATP-binding protein [Rhizobium sp. Leaf384]KQS75872.1 glycerol-3-phosphate ABC transporter ATP-binding protein [Rhizobium sp. Leaf383]
MAGHSIDIRDLEKRFDRTQVLKRINLHIREGEFLTLLGPSGCGKSTLLRLLAGFEPCTAGRILMDGRDILPLPPKARDIAMVFQSYALYPHMTVRGNLAVPLEMSRLTFLQRLPGAALLSPRVRCIRKGIAGRVADLAEPLGLTALLDRKPAQLSGGQRQRVAVGRAMARHPSVFLMDEPLSNLDAKLRQDLRAEIIDLHRRTGITFVYVTHDQSEALAMSDRVAVMEDGEIRQCATPHEIYDRPDHLSVARFVGATAINEMPATVRLGAVSVNGVPLQLNVAGLPDGEYRLAVRPERLHVVDDGRHDFSLPVDQIEFTGNEVGIRCNGAQIGAGTIRVQLRPENFARLRQGRAAGERIPLGIAEGAALFFDASGRRVSALPLPSRRVQEVRREHAV